MTTQDNLTLPGDTQMYLVGKHFPSFEDEGTIYAGTDQGGYVRLLDPSLDPVLALLDSSCTAAELASLVESSSLDPSLPWDLISSGIATTLGAEGTDPDVLTLLWTPFFDGTFQDPEDTETALVPCRDGLEAFPTEVVLVLAATSPQVSIRQAASIAAELVDADPIVILDRVRAVLPRLVSLDATRLLPLEGVQ